jgi:hypothetical protein
MSYSTATPQQQARVNNFVQLQRAASVLMWELNKAINAMNADWNADILAILGSPQGITITDGTGYAGAVPLTDTQVTNLVSVFQAFQSGTMTAGNQTVFALASGPNNML